MLRYLVLALFGAAVCNAAVLGGGLLGGFSPVSPNDKDVKDVLSFVETSLNAMSNDMYSSRLEKVVKVERQLVNGLNYRMEFEFARTECSKMSLITLESCSLSGKVQTCTAEVYESFSEEKSLKTFKCTPKVMEKRAGAISGPVDDPSEFRDEAIRAMSLVDSKLDMSKDSGFKVVEVRTQVVAGMMLYMKVQGKNGDEKTMCDMTVWSRPWMPEPEDFMVQAIKCKPIVEVKSVRSLGGVSDETAVTDEVKDMFFEALQDANEDYGISLSQDETELLSMTSQTVQGKIYVIKLRTTQDGQVKECEASLWVRLWMTPQSTIHSSDC